MAMEGGSAWDPPFPCFNEEEEKNKPRKEKKRREKEKERRKKKEKEEKKREDVKVQLIVREDIERNILI